MVAIRVPIVIRLGWAPAVVTAPARRAAFAALPAVAALQQSSGWGKGEKGGGGAFGLTEVEAHSKCKGCELPSNRTGTKISCNCLACCRKHCIAASNASLALTSAVQHLEPRQTVTDPPLPPCPPCPPAAQIRGGEGEGGDLSGS